MRGTIRWARSVYGPGNDLGRYGYLGLRKAYRRSMFLLSYVPPRMLRSVPQCGSDVVQNIVIN